MQSASKERGNVTTESNCQRWITFTTRTEKVNHPFSREARAAGLHVLHHRL